MSFSGEWDEIYKAGGHNSVWPWSDLISLTYRYSKGNGKGQKVLELGCGAGANIPFFLSLGMDYYGIEGSEHQTKILNERFEDRGVKVMTGDFTKGIPFEEMFDYIVDRGSVTCNSDIDVKNTLAAVYEKLAVGGYFFGVDWFSDGHDALKQADSGTEFVDPYTCIFHKGYFAGLGTIHFFTEQQIYSLFRKFSLLELTEKKVTQYMPEQSVCASWNFAARKLN